MGPFFYLLLLKKFIAAKPFIFNIFNIVTCNKQQYFKNSTLKKIKSENDLRIYQNKYSKKNKLYRTDNSYVYHLIKDNDYHINDFIRYKNIDYFYKNHQIPINSYSVNSSPISSPPFTLIDIV